MPKSLAYSKEKDVLFVVTIIFRNEMLSIISTYLTINFRQKSSASTTYNKLFDLCFRRPAGRIRSPRRQ